MYELYKIHVAAVGITAPLAQERLNKHPHPVPDHGERPRDTKRTPAPSDAVRVPANLGPEP